MSEPQANSATVSCIRGALNHAVELLHSVDALTDLIELRTSHASLGGGLSIFIAEIGALLQEQMVYLERVQEVMEASEGGAA